MSVYLTKTVWIVTPFACVALAFIAKPGGDRWFMVGVLLVFAAICACFVLMTPVLCCPNCGRATMYFDNYSESMARLTGRNYRHVECAHCHSIIDRLCGNIVGQISPDDGRKSGRLIFLIRLWLAFLGAGGLLIFVSTVAGLIVFLLLLEGRANNHRVMIALLGCVGVFIIGLLLVATGWRVKRRAHRFAEQNHIQFPSKIFIRW